MPFDHTITRKTDLRVKKTEKALMTSMLSLLKKYRFTKLTVDRLCKEGQLSRATFYSHFTDKYDLLEFWLFSSWALKFKDADNYDLFKESINRLVDENKVIIKNVLIDADQQTIDRVQNFICAALKIDDAHAHNDVIATKDIVTSNLYIGGIIYYLLWQVRNNFPPEVPVINEYSYDAVRKLREWSIE